MAKQRVSFKMGLEQGCYIEELMCEFDMNGVKGGGFVECEWRINPY